MSRAARLVALAVLATAACATPPRAAPSRLVLERCRASRPAVDVRCAVLEVFEDRTARSGRTIPLNILVLPALTESPAPDPIFVLAGGPGGGAASGVDGTVVDFFRPMRAQRDVVFVDQRGTGESHHLACRLSAGVGIQAGFGELLRPERVRACREDLERIADLRLYTTPIAMDDLDDVRAALGHEKINLYGVSYGTLAALQYLRQHPSRVRSLALAGVATPAQKLPLQFAAGAQAALDRLLTDCAADEACHRAYPDLAADARAVFARFDGGPVTFDFPSSIDENRERLTLSRPVFAERLRLMLYSVRSARRVPFVLHRAAQGDWIPFARATSPALSGTSRSFAMGMYLSVTCSESVATLTEEDVVTGSRSTFVGEERTRAHLRACREWRRGVVPSAYYTPVKSRAPVLMLSGALDPATPARYATEAARTLPNARQVLIRNLAHDYSDDCLRDLVAEFFARGTARDLDTGCVDALRRPPFAVP